MTEEFFLAFRYRISFWWYYKNTSFLKYKYSEKATKFCEISTLLLSYVVPVKSYVAFSEYMNFRSLNFYRPFFCNNFSQKFSSTFLPNFYIYVHMIEFFLLHQNFSQAEDLQFKLMKAWWYSMFFTMPLLIWRNCQKIWLILCESRNNCINS